MLKAALIASLFLVAIQGIGYVFKALIGAVPKLTLVTVAMSQQKNV